jgi:chromosome segregation ATPase
MTDTIERLHAIRTFLRTGIVGQREEWEEWLAEAADELDQLTGSKAALQTEIERLRLICDDTVKHLEEAEAEIERLGSEVKRWKDAEERADRCIADQRKIIEGTERRESEYLALVEKHATDAENLRKQIKSAEQMVYDSGFRLGEAHKEIARLKNNQMSSNYVTVAQAAAFQAQHADASAREADAQQQRAEALDHKCSQFTEALLKGMTLIDELLRENVRLCSASNEPPNVKLFTAKNLFDAAMHKLLGEGD